MKERLSTAVSRLVEHGSDTITAVIAIAVLVFLLIGTVFFVRFAVWFVSRIFSRRSSRRYTKQQQDRGHQFLHVYLARVRAAKPLIFYRFLAIADAKEIGTKTLEEWVKIAALGRDTVEWPLSATVELLDDGSTRTVITDRTTGHTGPVGDLSHGLARGQASRLLPETCGHAEAWLSRRSVRPLKRDPAAAKPKAAKGSAKPRVSKDARVEQLESQCTRMDYLGLRRKEPKVISARGHAPEKDLLPSPVPPLAGHSSQCKKPTSNDVKGKKAKQRISSGWVPKDGNAYVSGRETGGMIYVGRGPRISLYSQPDNAFIDPSKNVASRGGDYEGQGMDYWPNYSTIDARSRATYLDWLSSGRSDTRYNVGYVFLYFYGLERRVFVDKADAHERADIVAEVRRLLEVYGDNNSIRRYLGAFVDTTSLLDSSGDPQPVFECDRYEVPANVLLALGRMAARSVPLTSDWVLSWYLCHPETRLRTPAKRAFAEFKAYFQHLFDQEYPNGLKIRIPRRRLKLQYHAASGNFAIDLNEHLGDIPDVSSLTVPLRIAQRIADKSADGLDKYSRFLGRNPDGRGSIEAHALLPEALWPLFPCPEKEELQAWATKQIESCGLVMVEDVVERLEGDRPDRLGKSQLIGVADALARLGVGMAPDPRFALRKPQLGEPVILFHLPKDIRTIESPSEAYRSAILNLAIATLVAHADGQIDHEERAHLVGQIDVNQSVTEAERVRLHANLSWMLAVPPDIGMLRTRLRNAPEDIRSVLGQLAVAAAGADGAIDPEEIRVIERLHAVMGLDRERVYANLHALMSAPEPVTVRPADHTTREFAIPSPPPKPPDAVILDPAHVSAVMAETARVSQLLSDIFVDDDADEKSVDDSASEADDGFNGLDAPHRAVVLVLITRRQWTEDEIACLADKHQLMAAGALETINEWAFDKFGDTLIEEHDGYEINGDIAKQLMR